MSQHISYLTVDISTDSSVFEFISTGPKGDIKKVIQFEKTDTPNVYNLSFGNLLNDGSIDDTTINDNKDRNKILATVADTVYNFTSRSPDIYVFFSGSTLERTRLYRMAISVYYEILSKTFNIWGLLKNGYTELFKKNCNYTGFLIKRKL